MLCFVSNCPTKLKLCISESNSSSFLCFIKTVFDSNEPCKFLCDGLKMSTNFFTPSLSLFCMPSDIVEQRRRSKYDSLRYSVLTRIVCRNQRACSRCRVVTGVQVNKSRNCVGVKLASYASLVLSSLACYASFKTLVS